MHVFQCPGALAAVLPLSLLAACGGSSPVSPSLTDPGTGATPPAVIGGVSVQGRAWLPLLG